MKDLFMIKTEGHSRGDDMEFTNKKKLQAWEDPDIRRKSCLKVILRPLLVCMALSGTYNFCDINDLTGKTKPKLTLKRFLSHCYRAAYLVILLIMIAKFTAAFFYLPSAVHQMNGLCLAWFVYLLVQYLVYWKASQFGKYEETFRYWEEEIIPELMDLKFPCPIKKIKARTLGVVVIAILVIVLNAVGIVVQIILGSGPFYSAPFQESPVTNTLAVLMISCGMMVWLIPNANGIVISRTLTVLVQSFNDHLANAIKTTKEGLPGNFERLRLLHVSISQLVTDFDQDLKWYYGSNYGFGIGLGVFNLYQIMKMDLDVFTLVMYIFWMGLSFVIILVTATFAAWLHEEVGLD